MKKSVFAAAVLAAVIAFSVLVSCSSQPAGPSSTPTPAYTSTITPTATISATFTITPTPVCTITLGYPADFSDGAWGGTEIISIPVIPAKSGTISAVGVKLFGAVSYRAAIYSDNSGEPGSVLSECGVKSGSAGWNEAAMPGLSVTQGVKYWLAVSASGFGVCDDEAYSNETWRYSYPWATISASGFPSGLSGWSTGTGRARIYAFGCF